MSRRLISSGSPFEAKIGYSRAVMQELPGARWCFVAGTTGYDYAAMTMLSDPAQQTRNILKTMEAALTEAGMTLADIVRLRTYLADVAIYDAITPVLGEAFRDIRPAATMVVAPLTMPEMLIEIEADAVQPIS